MRLVFVGFLAICATLGAAWPKSGGAMPAARPPGYISDKEEAKEALGVAPEMPGKVLTTVQPVEVEPEPVKAPKPLPDLFESEGMKFSDPENVMTLPGAKFDVARDPETKPEYGSTQESVAPPPPNLDYGDQQQAAPLPPIPASPDYTDSQVPVIPSDHIKESGEEAASPPHHHKKLRCPQLDPKKHSEPHPDTDQSCEQGFPGWQKDTSCSCDFLIAQKDVTGCTLKYHTLCTRDEDEPAQQIPAPSNEVGPVGPEISSDYGSEQAVPAASALQPAPYASDQTQPAGPDYSQPGPASNGPYMS